MKSIIAILMGIVFIIAGMLVIFWNETNALHLEKSLFQTLRLLVRVQNSPINPKNNQKPVYVTGEAISADRINDPFLGITESAIALTRTVEMYEWAERQKTLTEEELGGAEKTITIYTYTHVWS